jgi:K+ transporter
MCGDTGNGGPGRAMQLDLMPRLDVLQTSTHISGQIYIPQLNWVLLVAVLALVLGFQSSSEFFRIPADRVIKIGAEVEI